MSNQFVRSPEFGFDRDLNFNDLGLDDLGLKDFSEISPKDFEECGNLRFDFDDDNFLPPQLGLTNSYEPKATKPRVSDKLNENRLRKMQIDLEKEQEKINVINKRREKFQELNVFLEERNLLSEKAKEDSIKSRDLELLKKPHFDCTQPVTHLQPSPTEKNINIGRKIVDHRRKADALRKTYTGKIHDKNQEKFQRVHENKKIIEEAEMRRTNHIHFREWNQYQNKIKEKITQKGEPTKSNPPDFLYQKHKEKQNKLQQLARKHLQSETEEKENKAGTEDQKNEVRLNRKISSKQIEVGGKRRSNANNSLPSILLSKRPKMRVIEKKPNPLEAVYSAEYFGLHQEKDHKKSVETRPVRQITDKHMERLKEYIFEEKNVLLGNIEADEAFLEKLEGFLAQEGMCHFSFIDEPKQQIRQKNGYSEKMSKTSMPPIN